MHKIRLWARLGPIAAAAAMTAQGAAPATLCTSELSFQTQGQSLWGSGEAFQFDYDKFLGVNVNPGAWDVGKTISGGSWPGDYSVHSYFNFDADMRLGMQVGASVNGGTVDARLDYDLAFSAPDRIVKGEAFSLTAAIGQLGSSGFTSAAPTAEAYVDGILDLYVGGYMRFKTGGTALGNHDYRMGNKGFTDNDTNNRPYRTLANVNLSPEIVSVNRGGNGQLMVLGASQGGVGSEYNFGSTTITAGDWRVAPVGTVQAGQVRGSAQTTMLTATLDVDQMALSGAPALGTGIEHDWGVIDVDMGYEIVDVETSLAMGLKQDLNLAGDVMVRLSFSEAVLVGGELVTEIVGSAADLPDMTLLGDAVTVTPEFFVQATMHNATALTFAAGAALTVMEAHAVVRYDTLVASGTAFNGSLGPYYQWNTTVPLGDIGVYDQQFALQGFQTIAGESFVLTAVPEPTTPMLWLAGLGAVGTLARRRLAATADG